MPLNVQNASPRPTPSIQHFPSSPLAGRLIVERLDPLGEADGRIVPSELVCAHSQVKRIWARTAAGRQIGERGLGGSLPTLAAQAAAAPGPATPALTLGAQLSSRGGAGPRRASSLKTNIQNTIDSFSTEDIVLRLNAAAAC